MRALGLILALLGAAGMALSAQARPAMPTVSCEAALPSKFVDSACPIATCAANFKLVTDDSAGTCQCASAASDNTPSTTDPAAPDFNALTIERECHPVQREDDGSATVVKVLEDGTVVRKLADGTLHRYQNQCKCLPLDGVVATPGGDVLVENLAEGMTVWTRDAHGARMPARILATSRVRASPGHTMIHVTLADGHQTTASAGHPLATGKPIETLKRGDEYEGSIVVAIKETTYDQGWTRDLLPEGPTGIYWLNGVPMGSTFIWPQTRSAHAQETEHQ